MFLQRAAQTSRILMMIVFFISLFLLSTSFGMPIDVSYSVDGSKNNWTLNFSVTNNLGDGTYIYWFGVDLPSGSIIGKPNNWASHPSYNASPNGGSGTFNIDWINGKTDNREDLSTNLISPYVTSPNNTLSGFSVLDKEDLAPTSVNWFAFSEFGNYNGTLGNHNGFDFFYNHPNPPNFGFEGSADPPTTAPEPSTFLLIAVGLAGIGFLRRIKLVKHVQ